MTTTQTDPLARASATPNVAALIQEFTYALDHGPANLGTLSAAEDTRLNRWPGKSPLRDGLLHQKDQPQGKVVIDKHPDTEVNLCDEILLAETDIDLMALQMAQVGANTTHVNRLTAAQTAELIAVVRKIVELTAADREDGAELLSQMKGSIGWCVLHTGWREKWGLVERTVTMDEVFAAAIAAGARGQVPGVRQIAPPNLTPDTPPSALALLPGFIMDETLEAQAVAVIAPFVPHLKKTKVRALVRDLRTEGEATFLDRQIEEKRPYLQTLIPGVDVFVSGGAADAQSARGWLRIEFLYEAQVRAMAVDANWNEEFIDAVIGTAGQVSGRGAGLVSKSLTDDAHERRIEIWTSEVRQFDEDLSTTGIYCTTFSPHLTPGTSHLTPQAYYATHYLLDSAHGQYPYITCRREVIGPALDHSRGVPEMVRADSNQIKLHQDALARRSQWEVNPAIIKTGMGWSKIKEPLAPGSDMLVPQTGADAKAFALDRGNPSVGAGFIERIEKATRRRFALPNNGSEGDHPSLWQMRQARQSGRFLNCFRRAYAQLAVLCYQEYSPEELAQIIGRPPLLTVKDLLRCQVTLKFEPRAMDTDWTATVLKFITQIMTWDKGGLIDTAPLMRIGLSYIDTTIIDEVLREPQGAQAQMYRKVEQDVSSIVLGNPPPLVEMDASAGMQLQMAFAVVGKNPKYQQVLANDPQAQENFKTYMENLQHSHQETQISPVQGRLGVAEMPQKPVQRGNAMA